MTTTSTELQILSDRSLVALSGPDAEKFLQGVITNDVALLENQDFILAALLSPQGKVLFEFYVIRAGDDLWIDVARSSADELVKRLSMYKLRADVRIADVSASNCVAYATYPYFQECEVYYFMARHSLKAPFRGRCYITAAHDAVGKRLSEIGSNAPDPDHETNRISLGIPEGGKDYAFGEIFPHEAMLDQLNGVSFTKGCYVGQEIVSRMEHRGTARSRFLMVAGDGPLPVRGTEVLAGERPIGVMGSRVESHGLALVRLDRLTDAYTDGKPITTSGVPITLTKPPYATFSVPELKP